MADSNEKKELKQIVDILAKQGKMAYIEGATVDQISDFETKHNVKFPDAYKEWLLFSDGGECFLPAGVQFYGVAHKPLIDVTVQDKPEEKYLVIGALASGDPILCEKESEKISIYNHEGGRIEADEVYVDFYAFLRDLYDLLGIGE